MNANNSRASIWPTVWKWTLILAAFKAVFNLALWITGLITSSWAGPLGIVVSITLVVFALRSFRTRNNGYLTFGQGFGIAYVASVLSAAISSAVQAVYVGSVGSEQLTAAADATKRQLGDTPGLDTQMLDMLSRFYDALYTPGGIFIAGTCLAALGWLIAGPIVAAIVKKPPPLAG